MPGPSADAKTHWSVVRQRLQARRYADWDQHVKPDMGYAFRAGAMDETPRCAESPPEPTLQGMRGKKSGVPYYAASCAVEQMAPWFPDDGAPASFAKARVSEYQLLDFNPMLNTSSYVNVVFEQEELDVANLGLKVNIADQTIYPGSFRLHNDTLNMVADLWNCPRPKSFAEFGCFAGAGVVGSTEGCLLAGLALKFRWRAWYAKRHSLDERAVRREYPNMIISTLFQACWEKAFRYFDIEPVFIKPDSSTFTMSAEAVKAAVNEHTIGVVCIMGNHYGGQYDPVCEVAEALRELNEQHGWQVGIHVDAASGGFVAPFQRNVPPWDFRVPEVLSISGSGHKFGVSCCGTGWVVWREREDLSDHVAVDVSYLGGRGESYTLNFSRPASGSYVQLFKFIRLGREGYAHLIANQMANANYIRDELRRMEKGGVPFFKILDHGDLPVVAAMLNPELDLPYDAIDLQHALSERHWYVSGYKMSFHEPNTKESLPLFSDMPASQSMFRVVVKQNLTRPLAADLVEAIASTLSFLERSGKYYLQVHEARAHEGDDEGTSGDNLRTFRAGAAHTAC